MLVTGPTGSGKSTTLAAMVDRINSTRPCHILTIEDPIEYVHRHKLAAVNQREVGTDTDSFAQALRSALREDPDVLLVGELRDLESIQTALTIAETGHLVLATLHTNDTSQALDRIVDVFPGDQQAQIRVQLASVLVGILYQRLLPRIGGGRVAAHEVLVATTAVRNMIREGKSRQLRNMLTTGTRDGHADARAVADGAGRLRGRSPTRSRPGPACSRRTCTTWPEVADFPGARPRCNIDAVDRPGARSSTDRASDYGSEG